MADGAFSKKVYSVINNPRLVLREDNDLSRALGHVSTFYQSNSTNYRRQLRTQIEKKALETYEVFLQRFKIVHDRIEQLHGLTNELKVTCDDLEEELQTHQKITQPYLSKVTRLRNQQILSQEKKKAVQEFLRQHQLTDSERKSLIQGDVSSPQFCEALNRVYDIQVACKKLFRDDHHLAPVEIFDEMLLFQNAAYDRLSRWIQERCHYADSFFEDRLRVAIGTLMHRPVLLKGCVSEIVEARRNFLRIDFFESIRGEGSLVGRKAHDPIRYMGDVLAWVHQHLAAEIEMIRSLFSIGVDSRKIIGRNIIRSSREKSRLTTTTSSSSSSSSSGMSLEEKQKIISEMLNDIFQVLIQPVIDHVESVLKDLKEVVEYFRCAHLLEFYKLSMGKFLGDRSKFVSILEELRMKSLELFSRNLESDLEELRAAKMTLDPSELKAPRQIEQLLLKLKEILRTYDQAVLSSERRLEDFRVVLKKFLKPIHLKLKEMAEGWEGDPGEGQVFLMNSYYRISSTLKNYSSFAEDFLEEVNRELNIFEKEFTRHQSAEIIHTHHFTDLIRIIQAWRKNNNSDINNDDKKKEKKSQKLSEMDGFLSREDLGKFVQKFYSDLYEFGSSFFVTKLCSKIKNSKLRMVTKSKIVLALSSTYQLLYEAVHDKESGFENPEELLYHNPAQIKMLLDV